MTGQAHVIRGDARQLPLPDESVDLIITSPPYFALRSYTDDGQHYQGQIGSEATPAEWVDALIECTREWVRVLKPSGSLWVNLGDKFVADNRGSGSDQKRGEAKWAPTGPAGYVGEGIMPRKSLMGLPWRYAIRCIDDLGLILRAEVVWDKPNGLPESVTDRVRRSHEQWFMFTRQPRYFAAVDEIREPHTGTSHPQNRARGGVSGNGVTHRQFGGDTNDYNSLGKLPGSVWTVPSEPLRVPPELGIDHFAAFPTEFPRRIIAGWSPLGVCVECGQGRRPVAVSERTSVEQLRPEYGAGKHGTGGSTLGPRGVVAHITGYACGCDQPTADTRPSVILDPFGGTGTVALVAKALGRIGISVDLSHDYTRLAQWRTQDPDQLAHAMRVPKPPKPVDGQLDLMGGAA